MSHRGNPNIRHRMYVSHVRFGPSKAVEGIIPALWGGRSGGTCAVGGALLSLTVTSLTTNRSIYTTIRGMCGRPSSICVFSCTRPRSRKHDKLGFT